MDPSTSLVNLGELSKPATALIEKISEAVGGVFRPYQIRRVASAQADALKIDALAQIEISELQKRAMERFVCEEARKQDNIEAITAKALPSVNEGARPDSLDDDWIANFFDKCRLISNDEMQNLWSQILAGEANAPGRYSKRTIDYLASLDRSDAELFRALCGFAWSVGQISPLVYNSEDAQYTEFGVTFGTLTHLDAIGLVKFSSISGFNFNRLPKQLNVAYFGAQFTLTMPLDEANTLDIGRVLLTKVGQELATICGATPKFGFADFVVSNWMQRGIVVSSPWPAAIQPELRVDIAPDP